MFCCGHSRCVRTRAGEDGSLDLIHPLLAAALGASAAMRGVCGVGKVRPAEDLNSYPPSVGAAPALSSWSPEACAALALSIGASFALGRRAALALGNGAALALGIGAALARPSWTMGAAVALSFWSLSAIGAALALGIGAALARPSWTMGAALALSFWSLSAIGRRRASQGITMRARPWARLPVSSATLERLLRSRPGRRGPVLLWRWASERLLRSVVERLCRSS